jgi:Mycobacterium membrane protein
MSDPRRPRRSNQARQGFDANEPRADYQPRTDPAYSGQVPYGPTHGATSHPQGEFNASTRTERLPQYWEQGQSSPQWQYGQFPPAEPPQGEPPRRPSTPPRWLWIAAGAAVLLVVALVIALVIANGTAKRETAVPPLPAMPGSTSRPSSPPTSASPRTSTPPSATATSPAPSTAAPRTSTAGPSETVDYNVTGEGRAISISYVDDDGIMQIEFNVALPWSKEVSLPRSGNQHPAVTIVNIGHNVSCSVTVDGVRGRQRNGVGLTVCDAPK